MKKGLSILLAAAMTLSLAACGGSTETANTTAAGGDTTTAELMLLKAQMQEQLQAKAKQ